MATDITQIPCLDGKLYIAPAFDVYNGETAIRAMDDNIKKEHMIFTRSNEKADPKTLHLDIYPPDGEDILQVALRYLR
jgi:hypothetical protein